MRRTENARMHPSMIEPQQQKLDILELEKQSKSTPLYRTCSICASQTIRSYSKSLFTCGHNEICLECLHQYSDHCLQQKNVLKCIVSKCPGTVKYDDEAAMSTLTVRLRKKMKESFKNEKLKNNKKCTIADCFGFINNGTCDLCLTNFCENCWSKEHRGNCMNPEFQLSDSIKLCPNCGEGIQKDGGCLHITCSRCKHQFCFQCLQNWSKRHHITCGTGQASVFDWILGIFRRND